MPPISAAEQTNDAPTAKRKQKLKASAAVVESPNADIADASTADDAGAGKLPVYVRFSDLQASGIANNWPTLLRLIEDCGFPPGVWLGKNTRAWVLDDVTAWLKARPAEKKTVNIEKARETRVRNALAKAAAENNPPK